MSLFKRSGFCSWSKFTGHQLEASIHDQPCPMVYQPQRMKYRLAHPGTSFPVCHQEKKQARGKPKNTMTYRDITGPMKEKLAMEWKPAAPTCLLKKNVLLPKGTSETSETIKTGLGQRVFTSSTNPGRATRTCEKMSSIQNAPPKPPKPPKPLSSNGLDAPLPTFSHEHPPHPCLRDGCDPKRPSRPTPRPA